MASRLSQSDAVHSALWTLCQGHSICARSISRLKTVEMMRERRTPRRPGSGPRGWLDDDVNDLSLQLSHSGYKVDVRVGGGI